MEKNIVYIKATFLEPDAESENKYLTYQEANSAYDIKENLACVYLGKNVYTEGPLSTLGHNVTLVGRPFFESDLFTEDQIAENTSFVKVLRQKNGELRKNIDIYTESEKKLRSEYDKLNDDLKKCYEEHNRLQGDYEKLKGDLLYEQNERKLLDKNKKKTDEMIENYQHKITGLNHDYETIINVNAHLNKELEKSNNDLSENHDKLITCQNLLSEKEKLADKYLEEFKECKKEKLRLQETIDNLVERIPAKGWLNSEDVVKFIQAVKGITPSNKKVE